MKENQPSNTSTPDWRELRRQGREQRLAMRAEWRAQRRAWRGSSAWIVGAVLILVGLVLMLQNVGAFALRNWWALFILIPAVGSLLAAWSIFTGSGGLFSAMVVGPLLTGIILMAITVTFVLNLNWGLVGPILLILLGISALVGAFAWRNNGAL